MGDSVMSTAAPTTASTPSKRDAIVDALMTLAADRPWNDIELVDIAEAAGVSLAEFRELFPSKGAVLGAPPPEQGGLGGVLPRPPAAPAGAGGHNPRPNKSHPFRARGAGFS